MISYFFFIKNLLLDFLVWFYLIDILIFFVLACIFTGDITKQVTQYKVFVLCLGISSDNEKQEETESLGECPVPSIKKAKLTKSTGSVAVPIMYTFSWCLVMFTIIG